MNSNGKATRKSEGGNRHQLKMKGKNKYMKRPGLNGGKTRKQKEAAKAAAK